MAASIAARDWPALLGLMDQALDIPAAERAGWLRQQKLSGPLQAALEELLQQRQHLEAQDFMAALPSLSAPLTLSASPFASGASIGPWRLLRQLGQGGMSVVWLAQRADVQVERQVALKLPHAGPGQDVLARRMLRERRILAALEHPHIARLYDVGLTEAGTPYLVMEYVQGDNLLVHADAHRLTVPQRLQLFEQVLAAMQYAHGKLVLHRDLKPANILVSPDGQVKLLDFGIAKVMSAGDAGLDATDLTHAAGRQLTPRYASPEQLMGLEPGTASDLYSLGVVLYELLCGERPHTHAGATRAGLEAAVIHEDPRPPSRQALGAALAAARGTTAARLAAQMRGDLDAIVLKALATAPEARYASVEAFAADLRCWRAGRPVAARAPGAAYHLSKFMRRNRLGVGLGGLALVALLLAGSTAAVQGWKARQQAERAAMARDFLLELFAESSPERLAGARLMAPEVLERGRLKAQSSLPGQPLLQAELLAGIGETQLQTRDMASADAALAQAAAIFRMLGNPAREAAARLGQLDVALTDAQWQRAPALLAALQPLTAVIAKDRLLQLRWLLLSGLGKLASNPEAGLSDMERCLAMADEDEPAEAAIALRAHLVLANERALRHQASVAEAHLRAAERVAAPATPYGVAEKAAAVAKVRASSSMFDDGFSQVLQWLPGSIAHCDQGLGRDSPRCSELRHMRLWALLRVGDGAQALALAEELQPMLERESSQQGQFMSAYLWVRILAANGRLDRSHLAVRRLEALLTPAKPAQLPAESALPALAALATLQLRAGDIGGAERWIAQADGISATLAPGALAGQRDAVELARGIAMQARGEHVQALQAFGKLCTPAGPHPVVEALNSLNCVPSLIAADQLPQAQAVLASALGTLETRLGPDLPATRRTRELRQQVQATDYRPPPWRGAQVFISGIR